MRLKLAAIVLTNAIAVSANASPVATADWGLHDTVETAAFHLPGQFEAFFRFVLADAVQLSSTVLASKARGENEQKGGTVSLVAERGDGDTLIGGYDFGWQTPKSTVHLFDLLPGSYYYRLSRTSAGSNGGSYEMTSSLGGALAGAAPIAAAAEVPEPQGIALVLAALAALGWVSWRIRVAAPPPYRLAGVVARVTPRHGSYRVR